MLIKLTCVYYVCVVVSSCCRVMLLFITNYIATHGVNNSPFTLLVD